MADRTIRHIEHTRRIDILSEQELEDIREASLEVLERTGIEVAVRAHAEGAREGGRRDRRVDRASAVPKDIALGAEEAEAVLGSV